MVSFSSLFSLSPVLPSVPLQNGEAPSSPQPSSWPSDREAASSSSADERIAPQAPSARLNASTSSGRDDFAPYATLWTSAASSSATSAATGARRPSPCSSATHDETPPPHGGAGHYSPSASLQLKPLHPTGLVWLIAFYMQVTTDWGKIVLFCMPVILTRSCRSIKRFSLLLSLFLPV